MKRLVLSAVFLSAGFMFTKAQTVKVEKTTKTELKTNVVKAADQKAESTVSKILHGTKENSAKVADSASQTAKDFTAGTRNGLNTATVAIQNAAKTEVNVKADANANVKAHENANPNAAITTETAVKTEKQPTEQPKEKAAAKTENKVRRSQG